MSSRHSVRLPDVLVEELDSCGIPWEVCLGKKHHHSIVGGKLTGIWPRGNSGGDVGKGRVVLNLRAQIRKRIREIQHSPGHGE